jgi:hypothetical protein
MRLLVCVACLAFAFPLAGCGGDSEGDVPDQLERVDVQMRAGGDSFEAVTRAGTLRISGKERDFQLTVDDGAEPLSVDVHSPGISNLAALEGKQAQLDLSVADLATGTRTVLASDEAGPLYAADHGTGRAVLEASFGKDFVSYGDEVGREERDGWDYVYRKARFTTDDGPVDLLPGDARTLPFKGSLYRVAVVAVYQSEPQPETPVPGCGGSDDLLSYEMLRVEAPSDDQLIARPQNLGIATLRCDAE